MQKAIFNLTCIVPEDEHFPTKSCLKDPEQRVEHQEVTEEWHSYNMYSPSLKSCNNKKLFYIFCKIIADLAEYA